MPAIARLLVLTLLAFALVPGVAQAKKCPGPIVGDTDGDILGDLAVGIPDRAGGGAVLVDGRKRALRTIAPAGGSDRFGAAIALGDVTGDGCADLLAGAPGIGAVYVTPGSRPGGLHASKTYRLRSPGAAGDEFGASVVLSDRRGRYDTKPTRDLWVGAPGTDVAGKQDAGAIYHLLIRKGHRPRLAEKLTIDSRYLPGDAQAGDRFGSALAPETWGMLAGVAQRDVNGAADAGVAYRVRLAPQRKGKLANAQQFVDEAPAAGDRFGAAVAAYSDAGGAIVGIPGEDVGDATDAGAVQIYNDAKRQRLKLRARHVQGDAKTPGEPAAGDEFGSAVVMGLNLNDCQEAMQFAVGAPGDDVGGVTDAGSVTVGDEDPFESNDSQACPYAVLTAGAGLPVDPHPNARAGAALGLVRERDDYEEDVSDDFAVAIPGDGVVAFGKKTIEVASDGAVPVLSVPESGNSLTR